MAARGPHRPRLLRAHAQGTPRQRRRPLWTQPGEDRPDSSVGARRAERARRQAVDSEVAGSARAREDARRGRREGRGRLRHHDRAVRGDQPAAARARERQRRLRRHRAWNAGEARRLHGEHPPPDEDGGRRAEHPPGLVFRYGAAGRGHERHRHAPGGPGAVDAVPGAGDRLQGRHSGPVSAAVADVHSGGRFQEGDGRPELPRSAAVPCPERRAAVPLQRDHVVHAARRAREAERHLGLGGACRRRRSSLRGVPRKDRVNRGPPDEGRRLQARAVRCPQPRRGLECPAWRDRAAPGVGRCLSGRHGRTARPRDPRRDSRRVPRRPRGALRARHAELPCVTCRIARSCRRGSGRTCWRSTT